jgi:uncharacterized protein (TIGR00297 family)
VRFAVAAALAAAVAYASHRMRALTARGAVAAFAVGGVVFSAGRWPFAAVLFAFFIPSTLLSRAASRRAAGQRDSGKTGPRDALQVLANGGVAALCALAASLARDRAAAAAFAGAFAAASADTWGTEIGTLLGGAPRSILTLAPVRRGFSGGVTAAGSAAEVAGALVVGGVAAGVGVGAWWAIAAGGVAGALADSILGASLQTLRYCDACGRSCETDPHACGNPARPIRGVPWMNNDVVNALATAAGALLAWALSA